MTVSEAPAQVGAGPTGEAGRRSPQWWLLAVLLAGAWVVPLALYEAKAAVLLPFLLLAATVSLLRVGHTLLDRVVLSIVLMWAALVTGTLFFSEWPWGLNPVALSGFAFTLLIVVACVTGRRPEFPGLGGLPDLFIVGGTAATALAFAAGNLFKSDVRRLAPVIVGEDMARHIVVFNGIRKGGGYTFLHKGELSGSVTHDLLVYPQGSHLLGVVADNFAGSTTALGDPVSTLNFYIGFYILCAVFVILSALWAIKWVAGRTLLTWRFLIVAVATTAYLFLGDVSATYIRGFCSEMAGLILVPIMVAIVVRPLPKTREQLCVLSALLILASYTYSLWLPLFGVLVLYWAVTRHRTVLKHWRFTLAVAVVTAVVSAVPLLANVGGATQDNLNAFGGINPVNRHNLALLVLIAVIGLLDRRALRHPVRRGAVFALLAAAGVTVVMLAYQRLAVGHTTYYFEKILFQLLLVSLVTVGAGRILMPTQGQIAADRTRWGLAASTKWIAVPLSFALLLVLATITGPDRKVTIKPPGRTSWGQAMVTHKLDVVAPAETTIAALKAMPHTKGYVNYFQLSSGNNNYYAKMWVGALTNTYATAQPLWQEWGFQDTSEGLVKRVLESPVPTRVWTDDPDVYVTVQTLRQEHPDAKVELMFSLPQACGFTFEQVAAPPAQGAINAPEAPPVTRKKHCK